MMKTTLIAAAAIIATIATGCGGPTAPTVYDVGDSYSWRYAYHLTDVLYDSGDAELAQKEYVLREEGWYEVGDNGVEYKVVPGRILSRAIPGQSLDGLLQSIVQAEDPHYENYSIGTRDGRVIGVTYPDSLDPVVMLERMRESGLFTIGWLDAYNNPALITDG